MHAGEIRLATKLEAPILAAASKLFAKRGYASVSTKEIAAAAGVHETSLFRIFGTKDALFCAVLRSVFQDRVPIEKIKKCLEHPDFEKAMRTGMECLAKNISASYIRIVLFGALERPEITHPMIIDSVLPVYEIVTDRVRQAQREGDARAGDPRGRAHLLQFATFYSLIFRQVMVPKASRPPAAELSTFVDTWLRGALKR